MAVPAPVEFVEGVDLDELPPFEDVSGPVAAAPKTRPPEPAPDQNAAPLGWVFQGGQWRPKKPRGRPKAPPRVEGKPTTAPAAKAAPKIPNVDYRQTIAEAAEGIWFMLANVPIPNKGFGRDLSGMRIRTRITAAMVQSNVDQLATGINEMGRHVPFISKGLSRLKAGEGGMWVLPTVLMVAPFVAQVAMTWTSDVDENAVAVADQVERDAAEYIRVMTANAIVEAAAAQQAAHESMADLK